MTFLMSILGRSSLPWLAGGLGLVAALTLWVFERTARLSLEADHAGLQARLEMTDAALQVTRSSVTALEARLERQQWLTEQLEHERRRIEHAAAKRLLETQGNPQRHRRIAQAKPELYARLHERALRHFMRDLQALTCGTGCRPDP